MSSRILVVEDDTRLADMVRRYLEREHHVVDVAHDGRRALELARQKKPDLVVLDLMLPGVDGWDVCRILRAESDVPIIMVTARSGEDDTLMGLDLGADDYVTKPFSPRELVARVRTVLRRTSTVRGGGGTDDERFEVDGLVVDVRRHEASLDGTVMDLTPVEFKLLAAMAAEPGRAFSRQALLTEAFGWEADGSSRTIDVHILNVRRKLGDDPSAPRFIETVYGVGYRMAEPDRP